MHVFDAVVSRAPWVRLPAGLQVTWEQLEPALTKLAATLSPFWDEGFNVEPGKGSRVAPIPLTMFAGNERENATRPYAMVDLPIDFELRRVNREGRIDLPASRVPVRVGRATSDGHIQRSGADLVLARLGDRHWEVIEAEQTPRTGADQWHLIGARLKFELVRICRPAGPPVEGALVEWLHNIEDDAPERSIPREAGWRLVVDVAYGADRVAELQEALRERTGIDDVVVELR